MSGTHAGRRKAGTHQLLWSGALAILQAEAPHLWKPSLFGATTQDERDERDRGGRICQERHVDKCWIWQDGCTQDKQDKHVRTWPANICVHTQLADGAAREESSESLTSRCTVH
jgi:hypothetical protein